MFISKKTFTDSCKAMHAMGYKEGVKDGVKVGVSSAYGKSSIQGIWPTLSTEDLDRMKNDGVTITPGVEWGAPRVEYVDSDSLHAYHVVRVDRESKSRTPVTSDETLVTTISKMNLLNTSTSLATCYYTIEVF